MKKLFAVLVLSQLLLVACNSSKTPTTPDGSNPDNNNVPEEQIACTEEAKLCPDGSYVARKAPSCQFEACPAIGDSTWETATFDDDVLTFNYPEDFRSQFISPQIWPPTYTLETVGLECSGTIHTVSDADYCVSISSEGAAGSIFQTYSYTSMETADEISPVRLDFTLRFPQCGNYDEPERQVCEDSQGALNVDAIVHEIFKTMSFK